MGAASVRLSFASILAADFVGLCAFYQEIFGLSEVTELASPHFRGLWVGDTVLGFSAATAYDLLELPRPVRLDDGVKTFLTFEIDTRDGVGKLADVATAAGAALVQAPHETYYGAWQAVLLDPEGNAFRINYLPLEKD